ncbi:MAG TPA: DinB family protein [Pyrinomonadaceae bacterium]|jgi:DinB family protein|nr:DinB family protein [Pyrinomonadaceae bacterium]
MSITSELATLFSRDLAKLSKQIEDFPTDEALWQTLPGVKNSGGNLALHIEGNLSEFVGRQLGGLPYQRNRPLEFSSREGSRAELSARLAKLRESIPAVIEGLSADQLEKEYPEIVLGAATSTQEFLVHLYGHLNWHLGQVDYLRRLLTKDGAPV